VDEKTKKIFRTAAQDIPIEQRPFDAWAGTVGIMPEDFIGAVRNGIKNGYIRRFGAILAHTKSGMAANAMVAWKVADDEADRAGTLMAGFSEVTHCYLRLTAPGWPYNLYTMVHARNEAQLAETVSAISQKTGIGSYVVLGSVREFKKTSPNYLDQR
jgi:DNA-binding Lrp family transcriptional regulator